MGVWVCKWGRIVLNFINIGIIYWSIVYVYLTTGNQLTLIMSSGYFLSQYHGGRLTNISKITMAMENPSAPLTLISSIGTLTFLFLNLNNTSGAA